MTFVSEMSAKSKWGVALLVSAMAVGCGKTPVDASATKITHGSRVDEASTGPERVSTVGIHGQTKKEAYTCTASIIADDLLLTAAHCVVDGAEMFAYFGTDMRNARNASQYTQVSAAVVHPRYRSHGEEVTPNDIAVLQLSEPIPSDHQPVQLADEDKLPNEGGTVRLAGFGITQKGNDPDILRTVDSTLAGVDDENRLVIEDEHQRGGCSGDSGGPLFVKSDGQWYLAGVLSGGPSPCRGEDVYTSVADFRSFIDQASKKLRSAGQ